MEGRGPDRYWGWCRHHFLRGHFLMCLAVTHSVTGPPPPHGVPLGSTLSATQCFPVTSLPRTSEPLHAGPQALEEGQVWAHLWPQRGDREPLPRRRQGSQCCADIDSASPEGLCSPGPFTSDRRKLRNRRLPAPLGPPPPPLPSQGRILPCSGTSPSTGTPTTLMPA